MYRVWYSTSGLADYIIDNTRLKFHAINGNLEKRKMYESDANHPKDFHTIPDHIKKILYLDAPDLIVELDTEPIFSLEVSTEAGTGHNVFQRFARLAASVENDVPTFYVYPEAAIIRRVNNIGWDVLNPLIFQALYEVMDIYKIPALFYYFPSDYQNYSDKPDQAPNLNNKGLIMDGNINFSGCPSGKESEMQLMFQAMDEITTTVEKMGVFRGRSQLLRKPIIKARRQFMHDEYNRREGNLNMSPLTSTVKIDTNLLMNYLHQYENQSYKIGELLRSRNETIIYKINAKFRGDPYPGALSAIDYLKCREGKTFEDRSFNLVMAWGNLEIDNDNNSLILKGNDKSINDFINAVKSCEIKNLLTKNYNQLKVSEIPRYYMQVRYGSMFSKVKHIRVYSYFADSILFPDGALWRDA